MNIDKNFISTAIDELCSNFWHENADNFMFISSFGGNEVGAIEKFMDKNYPHIEYKWENFEEYYGLESMSDLYLRVKK